MSIRILHDTVGDRAVLYCSTSGVALAPVIEASEALAADEIAAAFLDWHERHHGDPRHLVLTGTLMQRYWTWRTANVNEAAA
jgi:hypothetical protein